VGGLAGLHNREGHHKNAPQRMVAKSGSNVELIARRVMPVMLGTRACRRSPSISCWKIAQVSQQRLWDDGTVAGPLCRFVWVRRWDHSGINGERRKGAGFWPGVLI
jgi:hypothetical protein